jgi:hypothetical protein
VVRVEEHHDLNGGGDRAQGTQQRTRGWEAQECHVMTRGPRTCGTHTHTPP